MILLSDMIESESSYYGSESSYYGSENDIENNFASSCRDGHCHTRKSTTSQTQILIFEGVDHKMIEYSVDRGCGIFCKDCS